MLGPRNKFLMTLNFVLVRQNSDGGFGASPLLPSTIEDTFYGLSILGLFQRWKIDKKISKWIKASGYYLKDIRPEEGWDTRLWFFYVKGLSMVGLLDRASFNNILFSNYKTGMTLIDIYYLCLLGSLLTIEDSLEALKHAISLDLTRWNNVRELLFKLKISEYLGQTGPDRGEATKWLHACKNPDGGFGFYPGSTSFIENVHSALLIYEGLNMSPPSPSDIYAFIIAARSKEGGFGRKSSSAPFLDATYHAIESIHLLFKHLA